MKNILWISRHEMTPEQFADLERALGDRVSLTCCKETVCDMEELRPLVEAADGVAAVLPAKMLAALMGMCGGRPVLQAVSERRQSGRTVVLTDGRREPEVLFRHRYWEQVLRAEVETRRL